VARSKNLTEFAKRMHLRGEQVALSSRALVRRIGVTMATEVINATPIKTGRAQLNWQVSQGAPARTYLQPSAGPASTHRTALQRATARALRYNARRGALYLVNNAPYIDELDKKGTSSQAPANFVRRAVIRAQRVVKKHHTFVSR